MTIKVIIIEYHKNYNPICENPVNKEEVERGMEWKYRSRKYWHKRRYANDEVFHYIMLYMRRE